MNAQYNKKCSCKSIYQAKIALVFAILSLISNSITIIYFSVKLSNVSEFNYIYDYKKSICSPSTGIAYEISTCKNIDNPSGIAWVSIWIDELGRWIVSDPFSTRISRIDAIKDRDKYDMGGNYTCVCRTIISNYYGQVNNKIEGCSLWTECIFNEDFLNYVKMNSRIYEYTFISFISASSVSFILCIISIIVSICSIRTEKEKEYIEL